MLYIATNAIDRIDFFLVKREIQSGNFKEDGLKGKWLTKHRIKKTKEIITSSKLKNISPHLKKGLTSKLFELLSKGGIFSTGVILKLIQQGADFKSPSEEGIYPLMARIVTKFPVQENWLVLMELGADVNVREISVSSKTTPFMFAARNCTYAVLHEMIRRGADPHIRDCDDKNALFYFIDKVGHSPFAYYEEKKIQETLLKFCDINAQDYKGRTPLIYAITNTGDNSMLRFLINKGAKLNIKDKEGKTALDYALERVANDCIKILKKAGADEGDSKVEKAVESFSTNGDRRPGEDNIVQVLIEYLIQEFKRDQGIDVSGDKTTIQRLKEAAEKAKIELSSVAETEINLPFLTSDLSGPKHMNLKLSRGKLENLIRERDR